MPPLLLLALAAVTVIALAGAAKSKQGATSGADREPAAEPPPPMHGAWVWDMGIGTGHESWGGLVAKGGKIIGYAKYEDSKQQALDVVRTSMELHGVAYEIIIHSPPRAYALQFNGLKWPP